MDKARADTRLRMLGNIAGCTGKGHTKAVAPPAMIAPHLTNSRRHLPLALLFFAACAGNARAQEYQPVVEDRMGGNVLPPEVHDDTREGREGLEISAAVSAAYNDNIFLSTKDEEADFVFRAGPLLAYTKGDAKEGRGFARIGYRPSFVAYADHPSENRVDHDLEFITGWRGAKTSLAWKGSVQKLGDAAVETLQPTDRLAYSTELRAGWNASEKWKIEAAYGFSRTDYEIPDYFDSQKNYGEIALKYAYSPKTEIGIAARIGRVEVDDSPEQKTRALLASLAWSPREKIRVQLQGGVEQRETSSGQSRTSPVVDLRVDWKPRERTSFYLNAYAREESSVFYRGQNYLVRGASAGVTQALGEKWSAGLEAGIESNAYRAVDGGGGSAREDRLFFLKPSLTRKFSDNTDFSIYYRLSSNSSTDKNLSYDNNILGVELNHKF